jgi:hypothetical protein
MRVFLDIAEQPGAARARLRRSHCTRLDPDSPPGRSPFPRTGPHNGRSSIGAGVVVGTALIAKYDAGFTALWALVGIANHRILDDFAADHAGRRTMVSTEL